jgi:hypothetical protein
MSIGVVSIAATAVMGAAFVLVRNVVAFSIVSGAAVAAVIAGCAASSAEPATCTLVIAGTLGWWTGLLLLRAMLVRSVSLSMLIAAGGGDAADPAALIERRLDDAAAYGLAIRQGDRFELTAAGRLIVRCAAEADRVLGRPR